MELDEVIVHPKRLVILSLLFVFKEMRESDLKKATGFSWGSLYTNLKILEKNEYIKIEKKIGKKGVITVVKITEKGYKKYLEEAEKIKKLFETKI